MRASRPLRRVAPLVLIAAAAGAYLSRRSGSHPAPVAGVATEEGPPRDEPAPLREPAPGGAIDIVTVVDDLLDRRGWGVPPVLPSRSDVAERRPLAAVGRAAAAAQRPRG